MINTNFLPIANNLVDLAGSISYKYFRKNINIDLKGEIASPTVTEADREIEKTLREYIQKELPTHNIYGEEFDKIDNKSKYTWYIDPIDGTTAFTCGKPLFTTLIALYENNKPLIGVIDNPILKERWCYADGITFYNHKPIKVNENYNEKALRLNATTPFMFNEIQLQKFKKVCEIAKVKSFGGDAYSYGLLANGYIDLIVEADLQVYDIAPILPIVEGAGGIVSDWQDNKISIDNFKGEIICSCNRELHKKVVEILN